MQKEKNMENEKLTLATIDDELKTLPDAISAAAQELREIETVNDQSAKGLDKHAKASSKLTLLKTRKAALDAARPMAEYDKMMEEVEAARLEAQKAAEALTQAEVEMHKILDPLLHFTLIDAVRDARPVKAAYYAFTKANGRYMTLLRPAVEFGLAHGIATKNYKKIITP